MVESTLSQEEQQFEHAVSSIITSGYAIVDGFLSLAESRAALNALQDNFAAGRFDPAGIGNQHSYQLNQAIRRDRIQWLDHKQPPEACVPFFQRLQALIDYFNRTCYLGIRDVEMHFALYPPGGFYKRHLDVFQRSQARKLSAICYLNFDWKEEDGGALLMYLPQEDGSEETVKALPVAGRLVLFNSQQIEHEVQVAKRERCSITGWLKDEAALI
ncbi:MAG TPA: 2OG-Fe(II) oxygenase [Phaeodactylibacter sp.]|nr:2OG-Fe(II) oxygenase [Phaeodactylibacter sp.]